MNSTFRKILSLILTITLLLSSVIVVSAEEAEEYLSDLRIVYADSLDEAQDIIASGEFADYKLLNQNLNAATGKKGVYLAYKTTTDVDDAITDIAVMQERGGYREGNYKAMLEDSFEQYLFIGEQYLKAIDYFAMAYNEGDFLAEAAYRQLNFYVDNDDHDGIGLGDLFIEGIDVEEIATIFMQGNTYALDNIRSLLTLGVSYQESGKTYLELVSEAAEMYEEDPDAFVDDDEYDDYARYSLYIATTATTFKDMFNELSCYEDELNYEDETYTSLELKYLEYFAMKKMMDETPYLNGESLYEFFMKYEFTDTDSEDLYPLIFALNEGQRAITLAAHFYDVVRYSISECPEEEMDAEITELEKTYLENPFNIYEGVDRSVFEGTFALTSEAHRADSYTEEGLDSALFGNGRWLATSIQIGSGVLGAGMLGWAISRSFTASAALKTALNEAFNRVGDTAINSAFMSYGKTSYEQLLDYFIDVRYAEMFRGYDWGFTSSHYTTFADKVTAVSQAAHGSSTTFTSYDVKLINDMEQQIANAQAAVKAQTAQPAAENATTSVLSSTYGYATAMLYIVGGALMLYAAITLGIKVHNYYYPDYDDVPIALVDYLITENGDRYIKYDVVYEAEPQEDGSYSPADTNAFKGQRWNALYYTKSYEAGKPLLAEFDVRYYTNVPEEKSAPVHRFGETVCYDLNKYSYASEAQNIYLSVKQSDASKLATEVPPVVASIFGDAMYFVTAIMGAAVGIGATLGIDVIKKKRKTKTADVAPD